MTVTHLKAASLVSGDETQQKSANGLDQNDYNKHVFDNKNDNAKNVTIHEVTLHALLNPIGREEKNNFCENR